MALRFSQTRDITAGSQFLGTEFGAAPKNPSTRRLRATEVALHMGSESKTWQIVKSKTQGGVAVNYVVAQSLTAQGAPGATTDTDVVLSEPDFGVDLVPGEQIQIITTGATAAMHASIQYEDKPNTADPIITESLRPR